MGKSRRSSLKYTPTSRLYWHTGKDSVDQLHSLLDMDAIFLSMDIEGIFTCGKSRINQFGLSALDTRHLPLETNDIVSSRHIYTRLRDLHKSKRFLFGDAERALHRDMSNLIRSLFYIEDPHMSAASSEPQHHLLEGPSSNYHNSDQNAAQTNKQYRDIVLVGHGIRVDIAVLGELLVNVQEIKPIIAVIDTELIGEAVFGKHVKLGKLLEYFGCPYSDLHVAGNDATFTMKALLSLALKSQWPSSQNRLSKFRQIASAPITDILNKKHEEQLASQRDLRTANQRGQVGDWADELADVLPWDSD